MELTHILRAIDSSKVIPSSIHFNKMAVTANLAYTRRLYLQNYTPYKTLKNPPKISSLVKYQNLNPDFPSERFKSQHSVYHQHCVQVKTALGDCNVEQGTDRRKTDASSCFSSVVFFMDNITNMQLAVSSTVGFQICYLYIHFFKCMENPYPHVF